MRQTSPHKPIISKENTTIQYLRSLSDQKIRNKKRVFIIEGVKMVEEALRDDLGVNMLVASPAIVRRHGRGILKLAESKSVEVVWISERLMDGISESKTPQPVMAVVQMRHHSEEALLADKTGLFIVTHQLQDPANLGSIIRTAEAAGAAGVATTTNTVDPYNVKSIRASMGSILRLPVVPVGDITAFIRKSRQKGFQTAATVLMGGKKYFDVDLTKPTVLILGRESIGLPQDIMADVDLLIHIPMANTIDSLNVATAAAVILYEAMRQRLYQ